jgi:hypothetical protein
MPSLNQAEFLEAALESVFSQSYSNLELVVADGGSTDGSLSVLESRQSMEPRLRVFSGKDTGPAQALNKALRSVRGSLIGWLNSDDLYAPGAIQRAVAAFDENPTWLMVYGHGQHIDALGRPTGVYPTLPPTTPIDGFQDGCFICQPTVFFRRSMFVLLGDLDEQLKTAFDFDYWLRAFKAFPERIGFIDSVQAFSRLHDGCITLRMRRAVAIESMQVLARHLGRAPAHWLLSYCRYVLERAHSDGDPLAAGDIRSVFDECHSLLRPKDLELVKQEVERDSLYVQRPTLLSPRQNETLAMQEFREGKLRVASTPRMLTLETTSRCNLRCVMCPHSIDEVVRPKHLDETSLAGLSDYICRARHIQLHGIGEPLISPAFWSMLHLVPKDCDSSINTNFTVLDDQRLEQVLDSNLSLVNVSVDAATPLTYERIRGFSFETVVDNIRRLITARRARNQLHPRVYMNMTLMRSNVEEAADFVSLASELGADCVCFWHLNQWPPAVMQRYRAEKDGWTFDYCQEGLWNCPEISNRHIRKAEERAVNLGIRLYLDENKPVYFDTTDQEANRG